MGVYDIIASVETDILEKLTLIITKKIEKIGMVNAKLTIITTETQMSSAHPSPIFLEPLTVQNG